MQRKLYLSKEQLATHFYIDKLSQSDVANRYNVGRATVYRLQRKYNIEPLEDWERRYPSELTKVQQEVLWGSSLGDDHLTGCTTANNASLMVSHAASQKNYAQLKFDIWRPFIRQQELKKTTRSNGTRYIFTTGGHPEFEQLQKRLYEKRNGKTVKIVRWDHLDKLTPISLAFWFMDDGSRCKNGGLAIHTNSFLLCEVQMICDWFFKTLKIVCWPQCRKKGEHGEPDQYVVFFSSKTSEKYAQIILPWVMPLLRYKLKGIFLKNPQRLHARPFLSTDLLPKTEDIV